MILVILKIIACGFAAAILLPLAVVGAVWSVAIIASLFDQRRQS